MRSVLFVLIVCLSFGYHQAEAQLRQVEGERVSLVVGGNQNFQAYKPGLWIDIRERATKGVEKSSSDNLERNECGNFAFDPIEVRACRETPDFEVTFSGFTPEAMEAFQYALDIWSSVLEISVPIKVDASFAPLGPGILGSAGATFIWELDTIANPGQLLDSITYPSALADQIIGEDIHTLPFWQPSDPWYDEPDMEAVFSSAFDDWYFGLDGCPGQDQIDFVTVVIHEIGHGLGFFASDRYFPPFTPIPENGGLAFFEDVFCVGFGAPFIFDTFLESQGVNLGLDGCFFEDGFLTTDDLTFVGPETISCFGEAPHMYAPMNYIQGSSTSHFDEDRYPGVDINALMTPFVDRGEAVHEPGCALAVLSDLGYDTKDRVPTCAIPTMGEWGVIILGLLLLIVVVTAVENQNSPSWI